MAHSKIGEAGQTIRFANGVELELALEDGFYQGIKTARADGRVFVVSGRGSVPYCVTPGGITYSQFRVIDANADPAGAVLECEAIGFAAPLQQRVDLFSFPLVSPVSGTFKDRLRIQFRPRSVELDGVSYHGFEVAYEWSSDTRKINWFYESVALAPGGGVDGARLMAQNMTTKACRLEEIVGPDTFFSTAETYDSVCIQSPGRGGGSQFFDLVSGAEMAAVSFFEPQGSREIALKANCQRVAGEDFVTVSDLHFSTLSSRFVCAPRVVLATAYAATTRPQDINRWSSWFDFTAVLWCRDLGINRTRAVPLLTFEGTGIGHIDPGTTYPDLLKVWAERMDWVVAQGFQGINLHTPEWIGAANRETLLFGGNNCCPWEFKLSDFLGGDAGLRAFCDVCHARGLKVYVWIAGHLHRESPVWKEHPEWIVRNANSTLWDAHYALIHALSFVHGAAEWMLTDLKNVRAATGIDGVWLDSFTNLTLGPVNWQSPGLEPNSPAVLRFLGDLSRAGFEIMIEGISQLGASSWGNLRPADIAGQEELMVNSSMRYSIPRDWTGEKAVTRDFYFRMLAARAPLGVWLDEFLGRPEPFPPPLPDWFAPLTHAYNRISDRMISRRLTEVGAMWLDAERQPAAFFAFSDGEVEGVPHNLRLTDLLKNETRSLDERRVRAGQIYGLAP